MNGNFFADYKNYIVLPVEQEVSKEEFDPKDYGTYYILTLSLYDSLISKWSEATKFDIDVEKSIETVLAEFNKRHKSKYHLQILELESDKSYFVLALSCKNEVENQEGMDRIPYIVEKRLSNPFYTGQCWFNLVGQRGRMSRKLFCFSFREYTL
ncbi:hypothetical protein [Bacillus sp. CECT 9360]|uniref:hypothetical protein n=1 Tax=Bacillus sp. CECT 9360 TaxID=2845821 RepID=UPI001E49069A|nr:hypothetical protein [Bacillus sp. CECT 9360]CAH0345355.1 hypothetical protein BCI9360_01640 [Bacillus sp. CECT 9360]